MKKVHQNLNNLIFYFENNASPLSSFAISFIFVLIIRNFLEVAAYGQRVDISDFLDFNFSFLWVAINIIFILYLFTKENIIKLSKIILPSFIIIWLAPIIDIFLNIKGVYISYYFPGDQTSLLKTFFTFFGANANFGGASIGLRIELLFVLISIFYFGRCYKKLSKTKSAFLVLSIYSFIFVYSIVPYLTYDIFNFLKVIGREKYIQISDFYHFLFLFDLILYFWISDPIYFKAFLKDLRFSRLIYYISLFFFGIFLGFKSASHYLVVPNFTDNNLIEILYFIIGFFFSCLFAMVTNNLADIKIGAISNPKRPHISLINFDEVRYKTYGLVFLCLSLIYSFYGGTSSFLCILVFTAIFYIYSCEPLRLKRIPFFSKIILSQCSLLLFIFGFYFTRKTFSIPHPFVLIIFLIIIPLTLNFIDLKNVKGDLQNGLLTLANLIVPSILLLTLFNLSQAEANSKLQDFSKLTFSSENYIEYRPENDSDIIKLVKTALSQKKKIRIRGSAHSLNGSSLPKDNELLLSTLNLNSIIRIKDDLIWSQSGINLWDLKKYLNSGGFDIHIINDGYPGPSIGGFISAGGMCELSYKFGGFWEYIEQINVIDGLGKIKNIKKDDPDFPWFFGSMGQLGVIESVLIKIKVNKSSKLFLPIDKEIKIPRNVYPKIPNLFWWNIFIDPQSEAIANKIVTNLKKKWSKILKNNIKISRNYVQKFSFIPPLVYQKDESFIWLTIYLSVENIAEVKNEIQNFEKDFNTEISKKNLGRYIQVELNTNYKQYFNSDVLSNFFSLKQKYDPHNIFNFGTVF